MKGNAFSFELSATTLGENLVLSSALISIIQNTSVCTVFKIKSKPAIYRICYWRQMLHSASLEIIN